MHVTYRDVDFASDADCERMLRWANDPAIKHLYTCFRDAEGYAKTLTRAYFEHLGQPPAGAGPHGSLMVMVDGVAAGHATFEFDTQKLLTKQPRTAWIALMIGEAHLRGRGLGKRIVTDLEQRVLEAGAARIEIGVFEYNAPSIALFTGLGYEEFARTPERVWWDDRLWADLRLLKTL